MKILVTGAAGFIGYHTARALLERGDTVVGLDVVNDYYDVSLKHARLDQLKPYPQFSFVKANLADRTAIADFFVRERPQRVVHLAAQPGVRYAFDHPHTYADANLTGFLNILEGCRHTNVEHLLYASSSSVYGANTAMPYAVEQNVDHPLSLYGATKKANELMAHSYAHLFNLPTTGLRFFTVYGPWGRPDMAVFTFTRKIIAGEAIDVFNNGHHTRDFTYVDDIVEAVVRTLDHTAAPDPKWDSTNPNPATSSAPYRIYNIGNHSPVALMDLIACIERAVGRPAIKNFLPAQPGDMEATYADVRDLVADVGFHPATPIQTGIDNFVAWYKNFYGKN